MTTHEKKKRSKEINRLSAKGRAGIQIYAVFLIVLAITISISVTLLLSSILSSKQVATGSSYRFCLATTTSDECVLRPGIVIGNKISKSPDKLIRYFASIPERVHRQWRVWVMDDEKSMTTELTVAEFYAWIDSVWNAQIPDASSYESNPIMKTPA